MIPRVTAVLVGTAMLAAAARGAAAADPEPIPWRDNYRSALKEADRLGRPVFMEFSADWCGPCRKMEATTYRDEQVVSALRDFVPLKVEFFAGSGLAKKFGVVAIPRSSSWTATATCSRDTSAIDRATTCSARCVPCKTGTPTTSATSERSPTSPHAAGSPRIS